jgi:hypothetical protein
VATYTLPGLEQARRQVALLVRVAESTLSTYFSGQHVISDDWSTHTPALSVFNGQLFAAWKGGGQAINVAKINLF